MKKCINKRCKFSSPIHADGCMISGDIKICPESYTSINELKNKIKQARRILEKLQKSFVVETGKRFVW